jgi:hypothetical protein
MVSGFVVTFAGRDFRCRRGESEVGAGEPENRAKLSEAGEVGDAEDEEETSDWRLSSLIFVWRRVGRRALYRGSGFEMALVDLEYGESSIGVMEKRDEGESKDCERWMRIFGEGVRGGSVHRVDMVARGISQFYRAQIRMSTASESKVKCLHTQNSRFSLYSAICNVIQC